MGSAFKSTTTFKAIFQLGLRNVWQYTRYQIGLHSGYYHLRTPISSSSRLLPDDVFEPNWFFTLPNVDKLLALNNSYAQEAIHIGEEIIEGKARLFGAEPQPLNLKLNFPITHWSLYERGKVSIPIDDIKLLWEPARFCWGIELGKAYYLSKEERFAQKFLELYQDFRQINPLNIGPNWQSAQEVALRLISLVTIAHLMQYSEAFSADFLFQLCTDIADHAERILPTLSYAKAQNNNHLISEAVGLFTASVFLKNHPHAYKWSRIGRQLFREALLNQIEVDGEYCQHSTNYHRMMLMLALWMRQMLLSQRKDLDPEEYRLLKSSVKWIQNQFDPISGKATNLGHNDGSLILPFTNADYGDYRPIVQAASAAFSKRKALPNGEWNDLMVWLGIEGIESSEDEQDLSVMHPNIRVGNSTAWASLRARKFRNRPAHADQLHVDLWYEGYNLLMDSGTYSYNAPPPWQNALAGTITHNTVRVDNHDQMLNAGRFLWLDWAQATLLNTSESCLTAMHNGYRKDGIIHQRRLIRMSDFIWEIVDDMLPLRLDKESHDFLLHWLLPDWQYQIKAEKITLKAPFGYVSLETRPENHQNRLCLSLIRAGRTLVGDLQSPILGWYSPTYNVKLPALSILYSTRASAPIKLLTKIIIREG